MDWETIVIPSDPNFMGVVERRVLALVEEHGFGEERIFALRLAIEEAIANAIKHGNKMDSARKVTFRFRIDEGSAIFEVADEGAGFDLDSVPDPTEPQNLQKPHGRGLLLMRTYADEVKHNEKGNCVHVVVHLERDRVEEECS